MLRAPPWSSKTMSRLFDNVREDDKNVMSDKMRSRLRELLDTRFREGSCVHTVLRTSSRCSD